MGAGTFPYVCLLRASEFGPSTLLLSYLTECRYKVHPQQKNGAWCSLRNGGWSKALMMLNCGVVITQAFFEILQRRQTNVSMEGTRISVKIAGAAAYASIRGKKANARNASEAAFASMEDSNISAKIAGAAAYASIRGSGSCVNIVEAAHFASIMSKDTFALIAAARALASTAESRQNAEIAMA